MHLFHTLNCGKKSKLAYTNIVMEVKYIVNPPDKMNIIISEKFPIPLVKVSAWFPCQIFTDTCGQVVRALEKCIVWVRRTTCKFSQNLQSDHEWVAVRTNEWCYTHILPCTNLHWKPDEQGSVFKLPPTLWPDPNWNCFIASNFTDTGCQVVRALETWSLSL